jgi:glycerol-3-phosphate O-acyltransferase
MAVLFQNDIRLRSGKISQPVVADLGILWLMQAYVTSMQKEGKTVHLIPVSINYERVFEVRNLATEMVSG